MLADATILSAVAGNTSPDGVVVFAPPHHLFGMIAGVLMPAVLRVPAWYRPGRPWRARRTLR